MYCIFSPPPQKEEEDFPHLLGFSDPIVKICSCVTCQCQNAMLMLASMYFRILDTTKVKNQGTAELSKPGYSVHFQESPKEKL